MIPFTRPCDARLIQRIPGSDNGLYKPQALSALRRFIFLSRMRSYATRQKAHLGGEGTRAAVTSGSDDNLNTWQRAAGQFVTSVPPSVEQSTAKFPVITRKKHKGEDSSTVSSTVVAAAMVVNLMRSATC